MNGTTTTWDRHLGSSEVAVPGTPLLGKGEQGCADGVRPESRPRQGAGAPPRARMARAGRRTGRTRHSGAAVLWYLVPRIATTLQGLKTGVGVEMGGARGVPQQKIKQDRTETWRDGIERRPERSGAGDRLAASLTACSCSGDDDGMEWTEAKAGGRSKSTALPSCSCHAPSGLWSTASRQGHRHERHKIGSPNPETGV
jgi:hypothetical protein